MRAQIKEKLISNQGIRILHMGELFELSAEILKLSFTDDQEQAFWARERKRPETESRNLGHCSIDWRVKSTLRHSSAEI